MNMYTTKRKVYAVGVREREMPIPRPNPNWRETPALLSTPTSVRARRRMFRRLAFGAVPGLAPICCDTNDPRMVEAGFQQRLLRRVPPSDPAELARFGQFVRDFVRKHLRQVRAMTFEEWLASTSYSEARKEELRRAHFDLRGGLPTRRQASHIDSFVKTESYPEWKWCRMINSRSDAFKVFSGPLIKAVEEVVYLCRSLSSTPPSPNAPRWSVVCVRPEGGITKRTSLRSNRTLSPSSWMLRSWSFIVTPCRGVKMWTSCATP